MKDRHKGTRSSPFFLSPFFRVHLALCVPLVFRFLSLFQVLYLCNNAIKDWAELDKLAGLPLLREVLFVGNPIYDGMDRAQAKLQVIKRLGKGIAKIDNEMVIDAERQQAGVL